MKDQERPEKECCERPEEPPEPESESCEHPHHKEHHHKEHPRPPFLPQGRGEQKPWRPEKRRPPMEWMPHDFDFYLPLMDELSLSEEQIRQLQSIRSKHEKNKIMINARIKVGDLELQELLSQPELDLGKVEAKIKEIGEMKIECDIIDVHAMMDVREVLTQEQKGKLKKLRPIPCNCHF